MKHHTYQMVDPVRCIPPHGITHPRKLAELMTIFEYDQHWGKGEPVLLGYWAAPGLVQLISGTHRHAAAVTAGIQVPVAILSYAEAHGMWGTPGWEEFIANPPTFQLDRPPLDVL